MRLHDTSTAARTALRQFVHEPIYALATIATLSFGIASASAIFSVVRGVILRPLPYADPASIVSVQEYQPKMKRDQSTVASANFARLTSARSFSGVTAFNYSEFVLSGRRRLGLCHFSSGCFSKKSHIFPLTSNLRPQKWG